MNNTIFPFDEILIEPQIIHGNYVRHPVNQRKQRKKWRQALHTRPNKNRK